MKETIEVDKLTYNLLWACMWTSLITNSTDIIWRFFAS